MTTAHESATTLATASTNGPITPSERLPVLDILRGFAILGMFVVVFSGAENDNLGGGAIGATGLDNAARDPRSLRFCGPTCR